MLLGEKQSVSACFDRGDTLYIIGFGNTGETNHIVAVIIYVSSAEGTYINWFAVSGRTYDMNRFGKFATDKPF